MNQEMNQAAQAAHRPMRRAKREITAPDQLRAIIDACQTVRIGATDSEGMFIVPLSFGYDWSVDAAGAVRLALWLHSADEGRKADAFNAGGDAGAPVALEMDREDGVITGDYSCAYSFAYRSIMGTGHIYPIHDPREKLHGLDRIMEHMAPGAPVSFSDEAVARVAIWRVDVERFTGKQRSSQGPQHAR